MAQQRGPMPGIYIASGRYYKLVREGAKKRWLPLSRVADGMAALHRAIADLHDKPAAPADSVPALVRQWEADQLPGYAPKTRTDAKRYNAIFAADFADMRAGQVSTPAVMAYLRQFADKPRTYNAHRAQVRELMRYAELLGWRPPGSNPTLAIRTATTQARTRYLSDSEFRRIKWGCLWSKNSRPGEQTARPGECDRHVILRTPRGDRGRPRSGPMMVALLELLYLTGQAIGDVLALDVGDVAGEAITFRRAKVAGSTGAAVRVRISPRLRLALDQLLQIRKGIGRELLHPALIVTQNGGRAHYDGVKSAWYRACDRVGVQDANLHDIKAKALTDVERLRGMRAARVMGQHATEAQTADYVRARAAEVVESTR
jgi:integrase